MHISMVRRLNLANKPAMQMLLTGDLISAKKAKKIGLINQVVQSDELSEAVNIMASKIASKSSMTITTGKKAFYQQLDMNLADAYQYAGDVMVDNMLKVDAKEGIGAFVEKRKPKWQDQ